MAIVLTQIVSDCLYAHEKINFDFDWQFHLGEDNLAMNPDYKPVAWQWENIQLPHDWSIHLEFDKKLDNASAFLPGGIGLYKKEFIVPTSYRGKQVLIIFDGVYHKATTYVNGIKVGYHRYGYTGFNYDISKYLRYGEKNVITVHVDHAESSRWYTGSGIYRHAWLQVNGPVHIIQCGTYITTPEITERDAKVSIKTHVANLSQKEKNLRVRQLLVDKNGRDLKIGSRKVETSKNISVSVGDTLEIEQNFIIGSPVLWSLENPHRYYVKTIVLEGNKAVSDCITPFGIRSFNFDANRGFTLNGKDIKLKGVCLHQDAGSLGTAVPNRSYERRLQKLKAFGCNAIRCSHNPPSPEFLEICDTLGFVVIDEAFDKWKSGYYANFFDTCWKQDLKDMIVRDRNHPSIMIWSVGNETAECQMDTDEGAERARMLVDFVHKFEPTRPVLVANQPGFRDKFANELDIVGYNYQEARMLKDHKKFPQRVMIATEVYPYYSSDKADNSRQYLPVNPWTYVMNNDFIAGSFIWAGVDYLGESNGWPSKGFPCCPFDMTMNEKPAAAYHHTVWSDKPYLKLVYVDPSLNIDPGKDHWQYPNMADNLNYSYTDDRVLEFRTITNCDSVRLIAPHRGMPKDFGTRRRCDYQNNEIVWYQPSRKGKILAIGYKNGKEVCRDSLMTTKNTNTLELNPDCTSIKADGQDLCHIDVRLLDEAGMHVQTDDRKLTVTVEGEGKFLALDNGDMRRDCCFGGNELRTYFGNALIIVQSTRKEGIITVKVHMEGVEKNYFIKINTHKN